MRNPARMLRAAPAMPPARYELLPDDWAKLELDYRTNPPASNPLLETVTSLLFHAAVAFAVMLLVRFFGWVLLSTTGILMSLLLAAPMAIKAYLRHRTVRRMFVHLLIGPAILLVIVLCHYATDHAVPRFAILLGAVVFLIHLADRIAVHSVQWMLANPRLTRQERASYSTPPPKSSSEEPRPLGSGPARHLDRYGDYALFPLLYIGLAFLPVNVWSIGVVLLAPPLIAYTVARFRARNTPGISPLSAAWMALKSWFSYGRHTPGVPGLFKSPAGTVARRSLLHLACVSLLATALLPSLSYFPVVYEASPQSKWEAPFERVKASVSVRDAAEFAEHLGHPLPDDKPGRGIVRRNHQRALNKAWAEIPTDAYVGADPENWIKLALLGRSELHFWALAASVGLCLLFPLLTLLTVLLISSAPYLAALHAAVEAKEPTDALERRDLTPWACQVARLGESQNPLEREHLWLGSHAGYDCPILLHERALREHAYLVGDSGSGKTALGMAPMLSQLVTNTDAAVVVIDLKGDRALFETVRQAAAEGGRTFKWFTNEIGKSTFAFNPLIQHQPGEISLNQTCETLLEALNLNHGDGYGRSYYSRVARRWLSATLRREQGNIKTFRQLYELSKTSDGFTTTKERQDAFELIAVIESLATFQQLNLRGGQDVAEEPQRSAIHFSTVIEEGQVVYFWLPSAIESATVREIAKLGLYSLLQAAFVATQKHGQSPRQTYLVIDEFQRIASENFKVILEQARGMGIGTILANQTTQDLKTADTDLRATVQTNTRFKQCFSATDLEQQESIMTASGEALHFSRTFKDSEIAPSTSYAETVLPRIQRNDVILASDHPMQSIIQLARGSGYSQHGGFSMPINGAFHISNAEYVKRLGASWPSPTESTLTPTERWMELDDYASVEDRLADSSRVFNDESDDIIIE